MQPIPNVQNLLAANVPNIYRVYMPMGDVGCPSAQCFPYQQFPPTEGDQALTGDMWLNFLDLNSANEENGEIEDIGVDGLHSSGKLDDLGINRGPIFWVDSADSQPCVGTVGNMQWMIKANGKLFHSGLPHMVGGVGGLFACSLLYGPLDVAFALEESCWIHLELSDG